MACAHCEMMGGGFGKPFVHVGVGIFAEFDRSLGISDCHDGSVCSLASVIKFKAAVICLGAAQICNRARFYFGLHGDTGSLFPVVKAHSSKDRFTGSDGQVKWAVIS